MYNTDKCVLRPYTLQTPRENREIKRFNVFEGREENSQTTSIPDFDPQRSCVDRRIVKKAGPRQQRPGSVK